MPQVLIVFLFGILNIIQAIGLIKEIGTAQAIIAVHTVTAEKQIAAASTIQTVKAGIKLNAAVDVGRTLYFVGPVNKS
jgi:uncharacterized protein YaaW (UPF0174 family)